MKYYIYKITNLVNNKIYIGKRKHVDPENDSYMGSGKLINLAIKKHGITNFKKDILHVFDNHDAAANMEKELVTKEFCKLPNTYNLHEGGYGGFLHINVLHPDLRVNIVSLRNKFKLGELKAGTTNWTADSYSKAAKGNLTRTERAQSVEAKSKRLDTFGKIRHQQGKTNSQFGTCWINHELIGSKKIKGELLVKYLDQGWNLGRKMIKTD